MSFWITKKPAFSRVNAGGLGDWHGDVDVDVDVDESRELEAVLGSLIGFFEPGRGVPGGENSGDFSGGDVLLIFSPCHFFGFVFWRITHFRLRPHSRFSKIQVS